MSKRATSALQSSAAAQGNATPSEIHSTLLLFLEYGESRMDISKKLIAQLETTDITSTIMCLNVDQLERLMPMLAGNLTRLQLEIADVIRMDRLCREGGVSGLALVNTCLVGHAIPMPSGSNSNIHLRLLGNLLPGLLVLHMNAPVAAPFPVNLRQLRALLLRKSITQEVLDQVCQNCPQLRQLLVRNEEMPLTVLDFSEMWRCSQLRELQVPLMLRSAQTLCHLEHLEHLSLQRKQLWPRMDWLPIAKEIINAKRSELLALRFDGTWLSAPFDFSLLDLRFCTAMEELLLSNCKLNVRTRRPVLPLSCKRFCLTGCSLNQLFCYLEEADQLHLLELNDCPLLEECDDFLHQLLRQCKMKPMFGTVQLRFSHMPTLSRELISWGPRRREYNAEWLQVQESHEAEPTWKNTPGTISMTFGRPVNYAPDPEKWNDCPDTTPADLLKELGMD
ncbi:uncharacterized protein LOC6568020 [Drosophila grimshawi]|uniref:GH17306 n=1 Tax=Drosophila grimshawi TaxID=7222 RepID=B4JUJ9_DROGR|nr:uncharacterized protein LOC6568020 [Drosophila grimshawi]EDV91169.1 GH17306 [Drosophila grimshawi]